MLEIEIYNYVAKSQEIRQNTHTRTHSSCSKHAVTNSYACVHRKQLSGLKPRRLLYAQVTDDSMSTRSNQRHVSTLSMELAEVEDKQKTESGMFSFSFVFFLFLFLFLFSYSCVIVKRKEMLLF